MVVTLPLLAVAGEISGDAALAPLPPATAPAKEVVGVSDRAEPPKNEDSHPPPLAPLRRDWAGVPPLSGVETGENTGLGEGTARPPLPLSLLLAGCFFEPLRAVDERAAVGDDSDERSAITAASLSLSRWSSGAPPPSSPSPWAWSRRFDAAWSEVEVAPWSAPES